MKINPQIFREYDIRGLVDTDLSEEFAYLLGRAYASLCRENNKNSIAVGHDCRLSSPAYAKSLMQGLSDEGIDSIFLGMGTTPLVYYSLFTNSLGGGIQITGSHNPSNMNGFKICLGTKTLSGADIQDLKTRVDWANSSSPTAKGTGKSQPLEIKEKYVNDVISRCKPYIGPRKVKVVVDAGNGVGGLVGPDVLRGLGAEVIELFTEPDGRFPNHHPDPTELKNIVELQRTVKESGADLGIGWDGDADRIGAVDEKGNVIFGDMLLLLFSRAILKAVPAATVIGDVKCSSRLFDDVRKHGGNPIMWKTGHSLIKSKLRETNAELAGEMSGHIFFSHRFFGFDDAIYASARLIEIVSNFNGPTSSLLSDVPNMISTPEIRVNCAEEIKFKIAAKAQTAFKEFSTNTIDGVRIQFDRGWGLIRASNTQPVLVLRFEAETQKDLDAYRKLVEERIEEIKRSI